MEEEEIGEDEEEEGRHDLDIAVAVGGRGEMRPADMPHGAVTTPPNL
jgi:hypothetical protein